MNNVIFHPLLMEGEVISQLVVKRSIHNGIIESMIAGGYYIKARKIRESTIAHSRPKKKQAKRRSVYFDEMVWGKLRNYAFFRKTSISRVLEKAALNYLENRRLFGPPDV